MFKEIQVKRQIILVDTMGQPVLMKNMRNGKLFLHDNYNFVGGVKDRSLKKRFLQKYIGELESKTIERILNGNILTKDLTIYLPKLNLLDKYSLNVRDINKRLASGIPIEIKKLVGGRRI